jgi:hypothetical protein
LHHHLGRLTSLILGATLAIGISLGSAVPVVACSCVGAQPMAAYAGNPDHVIFAGIVELPEARAVPVRVTRWFQGPDAPAIVWLDGTAFDADSAACGTALPPAGTEWIFVAYRVDGGMLGINSCTPHAAASAPTGQAMFADAVATFGDGLVVGPTPGPPTGPASPDDPPLTLVLLIAAAVALLVSVAGAVLLTRARPDPADHP